jgi:hypothetical protein
MTHIDRGRRQDCIDLQNTAGQLGGVERGEVFRTGILKRSLTNPT